MCEFYDPNVVKQCREDDAEEVKEKERTNFCDYFKPGTEVFDGKLTAAERKAKKELTALFGADSVEVSQDNHENEQSEADKLFK